jgi:hypothetical protein
MSDSRLPINNQRSSIEADSAQVARLPEIHMRAEQKPRHGSDKRTASAQEGATC